jgi:flagellar basal-body rod protein FlgF
VIDRFVYTSMTGAKHAAGQLATTTHNLANAQTLGFREMLTGFRAVPIQGAAADSRAFVVDSTMGFNALPGTLQNTGNPLDVALMQGGFFAVQVEGDREAYTRQGHMQVDANGYLVSQNGHKLLSTDDAPIQVGSGYRSAYINTEGEVYVQSADGQHYLISRLKVVNPPVAELSRRPDGLFEVTSQWAEPVANASLKEGTVEMSNVNVAQSMVEMIQQNRMFDLNMRMVQAADQNARSAQNLFSLSRT